MVADEFDREARNSRPLGENFAIIHHGQGADMSQEELTWLGFQPVGSFGFPRLQIGL
jgi:hypothetical protein